MSTGDCAPKTRWQVMRIAVGVLAWGAVTWVSLHFLLTWFAFSLFVAEASSAVLPESIESWRRTAWIALASFGLTQILAGFALFWGLVPIGLPVSRKLRFLLAQTSGFLASCGGFAVAASTGGFLIDPMVERTVRQVTQLIARLVWQ